MLVAPLLVAPTELTEDTEAYGLMLFESTDRIDATRHTTEGTEMIAFVASPKAACNTELYTTTLRKQSFIAQIRTQSLGYSNNNLYMCKIKKKIMAN